MLLVAEYCPMKQLLLIWLKFNLQTREFPIICQLCYQFIIHHSICAQASIIYSSIIHHCKVRKMYYYCWALWRPWVMVLITRLAPWIWDHQLLFVSGLTIVMALWTCIFNGTVWLYFRVPGHPAVGDISLNSLPISFSCSRFLMLERGLMYLTVVAA